MTAEAQLKIMISLFLIALLVGGAFIFKDFLNEEVAPRAQPIKGRGERPFQFEDEARFEINQIKNTSESFTELGKILEGWSYSPKVTEVKKNDHSYFILSTFFPLGEQEEAFDVTTTLNQLDQPAGQLENILKTKALFALEKKFQEINPPLFGKVRFSLVSDKAIEDYTLRVLKQNSKKRGVIRFDLSCATNEQPSYHVTQTTVEMVDTFESPEAMLNSKTLVDLFTQATTATFDFEKVEKKMTTHDLTLVQMRIHSTPVCEGKFDEILSPIFHLLTTFLKYPAP